MRIIFSFLIVSIFYTGAALAEIYVVNQGDNTVTNGFGDSAITVDVGNEPVDLVVTPDGDFIYVVNLADNNVSVIRTSDHTVVDTVAVGSTPLYAAVTPDGDFVYVTNSGDNNVSVIRTSDNTVVDTVPVGQIPAGVGTTSTEVYVANLGSNSLSVIDPSTNKVVNTIPTGAQSMPLGLSTGYLLGYNALVAYNGQNKVCIQPNDDCLDVGDSPTDAASCCGHTSSANRGWIFSANQGSNNVTIIDLGVLFPDDPGDPPMTLDVGKAPTAIVATQPDGNSVYVANMGSNTVTEINRNLDGAPTWTVGQHFPTGDSPTALALAPDTDSDTVANQADTDSDNDGITDDDETSGDGSTQAISIAVRNEDPDDPDGDDLDNERDLDSDGDCIPDHFEAGGGNDSDMDGQSDNFVDVDMDGHHDEHDADQTGNKLPVPERT